MQQELPLALELTGFGDLPSTLLQRKYSLKLDFMWAVELTR